VPYGYRRNGNGLEKDAGEQAVIRLVNDLYGRFSRLHDICRVLKEKHITTRNGRAFSPQQVKRSKPLLGCLSVPYSRLAACVVPVISSYSFH
jgi:uncharacterized glyoxalase superfamily metalloenzyme YdcJ